jgi:uncharacterized protein (TIGR03435 family)
VPYISIFEMWETINLDQRVNLITYSERMFRRVRKMRLVSLLLTACCIVTSPPLPAQAGSAAPAPGYEVASIKPDKSEHEGETMQLLPDGFRWTNFPVASLIQSAYGVTMENQIEGLPSWAKSDPYDYEAKADAKTAESWKDLSYKEQWKKQEPLMQSLLADRCQLKVHRETRQMAVYDLVIAKGGLKMKEAAPDEPSTEAMGSTMSSSNATMRAESTDTISLAFQGDVGRMIVDKTGLDGKKFDFELAWADDRRSGEATADAGPSIFTALEEQLGLKLVPAKGPVEVVVIDHIERPSPN